MKAKSPITTHVLDLRLGKPASGIEVLLFKQSNNAAWQEYGKGSTNQDGRVESLLLSHALETGVYKLIFKIESYFKKFDLESFYPHIEICFKVNEGQTHYHVPVLLSPFGYTTYRGS